MAIFNRYYVSHYQRVCRSSSPKAWLIIWGCCSYFFMCSVFRNGDLSHFTMGALDVVLLLLTWPARAAPRGCGVGFFMALRQSTLSFWDIVIESIITAWWFGKWLLFFHILGIIIPTDFHIFQRGSNHQPAELVVSGWWPLYFSDSRTYLLSAKGLAASCAVWTFILYIPYALYMSSFSYANGDEPGEFSEGLFICGSSVINWCVITTDGGRIWCN